MIAPLPQCMLYILTFFFSETYNVERGKKNNFAVEKSGKNEPTQVVKLIPTVIKEVSNIYP